MFSITVELLVVLALSSLFLYKLWIKATFATKLTPLDFLVIPWIFGAWLYGLELFSYDVTLCYKVVVWIYLFFVSFMFGYVSCSSKTKVSMNTKLLRVPSYGFLIFSICCLSIFAYETFIIFKNLSIVSIPSLIANAKVLYSQKEIKGLPYVGFLLFIGATLSGYDLRIEGRLRLPAYFLIIALVLKSVAHMYRADIIWYFSYFISGYFFPLHRTKIRTKHALFPLLLVVLVLFVTGSKQYDFTTKLESHKGAMVFRIMPVARPITSYMSTEIPVLEAYALDPEKYDYPGHYTLKPFIRVIDRLGISSYDFKNLENAQTFYYIGQYSNVGTCIREIHADFGTIGVVVVAFVLGLLSKWLYSTCKREFSYWKLLAFGHICTLLFFSYWVWLPQLGWWWIQTIFICLLFSASKLKKIYTKKRSK